MVNEAKIEVIGNIDTEVVKNRLPVTTRKIKHKPKLFRKLIESREYLAWKAEAWALSAFITIVGSIYIF